LSVITNDTSRPNDRLVTDTHVVMPAKAGIHDLPLSQQGKPWMPTFVA
jgi:hypothetical protein